MIEQREEELTFAQEHYLRQHRWLQTSSTPGFYWGWWREWNGAILVADQNEAIRMQTDIDRNNVPGSVPWGKV
jgi:hypothetical protein